MTAAVRTFVDRATRLAQQAAIGTLQAAFAFAPADRRRDLGRPRGRPAGKGQGKRTPADLAALRDRFVAFVEAHPGLRIEQINRQLGTTTAELMLPIRQVIAEGRIHTHGQKRSTTYGTSTADAAATSKVDTAPRKPRAQRSGQR